MVISRRIALWLVATTALAIFAIALSQQRVLDPLQNALLTFTAPAQRGIRNAADSVSDFFSGLGDDGDLTAQAQRLRLENQQLTAELARLRQQLEATPTISKLQEVAEERPQERFLLANVIARDAGKLREAVAIDRGRRDGIGEGMVVVGEGGALVGVISRALSDASWVTLITDPNSRINVLIQESGAKGVFSGRLGGRPILEMIPQAAAVKPGDLVVTSGLGGTFPKALLIGRIVAVDGQPQDPFKQATVEPAAPPGDLQAVLVLTTFLPPKLEGP